MKLIQVFLSLFYVIIFTSCNDKSNMVGINLFSIVYYKKLDNSNLLNIERDTNSNYVISIMDSLQGYLNSINGCGNCNIDSTDNPLIAMNFSNSTTIFIIEAGINGSTYGATNLFIIWQDQNWKTWEIYRVPFTKYNFNDIDKDGIDEIIEYKPNQDSVIYNFNNGLLIQYR